MRDTDPVYEARTCDPEAVDADCVKVPTRVHDEVPTPVFDRMSIAVGFKAGSTVTSACPEVTVADEFTVIGRRAQARRPALVALLHERAPGIGSNSELACAGLPGIASVNAPVVIATRAILDADRMCMVGP